MKASIGLIGTGNMGAALARAVCKSTGPEAVLLSNRTRSKAEALAAELGCAVGDNDQAARRRFIFLGVKPQMMADVLAGVAPVLRARGDRFILVTMAAGLSCARVRELAGVGCPVIRVMPNTPAAIGRGVLQYCALDATGEELSEFRALLAPAGLLDEVPEALIDAAGAVSGCGPAYGYLFIEALADGGWPADCQGTRPWPMPPRRSPARPKWCWRAAGTPERSRTPFAPPAAPPYRGCGLWSRAAFARPLWTRSSRPIKIHWSLGGNSLAGRAGKFRKSPERRWEEAVCELW